MKKHTLTLYTLGCRLNQAETATLENELANAEQFSLVGPKTPADIAVINTCTVTANGDADTRKLVNRLIRLNPAVKIALIGCQAQVQKETLAALPNVRWVIGNARKMELPKILAKDTAAKAPQIIVPRIERAAFRMPGAAIDRRHTRANLKIQDGCDFFCSYCEIPFARGRSRSRVFSDILREARQLALAGHKELVLTGINIGMYKYQGHKLLDVISALEEIPQLERLRLSSIEPSTLELPILKKMLRMMML